MMDGTYADTLTPLRITGLYILAGMLALVFSDLLLPSVISDPALSDLQLIKGAGEVLITGVFVYGIVWYSHRSLQGANRRLERNDEILQVLLRLLRHNIRNEMNIIQGHAETAHTEADNNDVEDSCHAILATADKLLRHTETVNELRTMLEEATNIQTYDVADLVEDVVRETSQSTRGDVETVTERVDSVDVVANTLLPVALGELIDNAIRHADSERPQVEFSTSVDDDVVHLQVADDGPGIHEDELTVLTEREESPLAHGSGLGLWFVSWVVADSDGEVSIETPERGGTIVTLSLRRSMPDDSVLDDLLT